MTIPHYIIRGSVYGFVLGIVATVIVSCVGCAATSGAKVQDSPGASSDTAVALTKASADIKADIKATVKNEVGTAKAALVDASQQNKELLKAQGDLIRTSTVGVNSIHIVYVVALFCATLSWQAHCKSRTSGFRVAARPETAE